MIDQDVHEYVATEPPAGLKIQELKKAIEGFTSTPHLLRPEDRRVLLQAARNWLMVERLPELLQLPGEPSLSVVQLNLGASGHFSIDGWIDEDSFVQISGSKLTPADALKEAFAKT